MAKKIGGALIAVFLAIIIGVAFIVTTIDTTQRQISTIPDSQTWNAIAAYVNETGVDEAYGLIVRNYPGSTSGASEYLIENFVIKNSTGVAATLTTDYLFNTATGNLTLINTPYWTGNTGISNLTTITYDYYNKDYVADGASRSLIPLIGILMVLSLLIYALYPIVKSKLMEYMS